MGAAASISEEGVSLAHIPGFRAEMSKKISHEVIRASNEDKLSSTDLEMHMTTWISNNAIKLKEDILAVLSSGGIEGDVMSGKNSNVNSAFVKYTDMFRERSVTSFFIGIDGSPNSYLALNVALLLRKKHDFMRAFHSWKIGNQTLDHVEMKRDNIETKVGSLFVGNLPSHLYSIDIVARPENETSKEALISVLDSFKAKTAMHLPVQARTPDFVVVGFDGNKKGWHTGTLGRSLMGSTTDLCLKAVHVPIILVKKDIPPVGLCRTFAVCVSKSKHTSECLDIVLNLVRPKDKIICLHCIDPDFQADESLQLLRAEYENDLHAVGPPGSTFEVVVKDGNQTAGDAITEYINFKHDTVIDFVALAPRQTDDGKFSSLTEHLISNAKTNIIICKH